MTRALVIIDLQIDFADPGGSLYVPSGEEVATNIKTYVKDKWTDYGVIVASKDFHIDPKEHFSENPDFKDTWPAHCVAGTPGADFHPNLGMIGPWLEGVFYKGLFSPAYSAFEGYKDLFAGKHTDGKFLSLDNYLRENDITDIDLCGLASDFCVYYSAFDAATAEPAYVQKPYTTRVLVDLCAGVSPETTNQRLKQLEAVGVELITSEEVVHGSSA